MAYLFAKFLDIGLHGTGLCLFILLIRKLLKPKSDPRVLYLLWAILAVRLLFPAFPQSPASIYNIVNETVISDNVMARSYDSGTAHESERLDKDHLPADDPLASLVVHTSSDPDIFGILSCLWALVAAAVIIYIVGCNAVFTSSMRRCPRACIPASIVEECKALARLRGNIPVVESMKVNTPCVFGIFRHTIVLPAGLSLNLTEEELSYILLHEMSHIRHRDMAVNWMYSILCALHWFNPLLWYSASCIKADQELCADYSTMTISGRNNAIHYGETLIKLIKLNSFSIRMASASGFSRSRNELKDRITQIYGYHMNRRKIRTGAVAIVAAMSMIFCTSAVEIKMPDIIVPSGSSQTDSAVHDAIATDNNSNNSVTDMEEVLSLPNRTKKLNYIMTDQAYYYTGDDGNVYMAPYSSVSEASLIYDMSGKNTANSTICYYETYGGYYFTYRTDKSDPSTTRYIKIADDGSTYDADSSQAYGDINSANSGISYKTISLGSKIYTVGDDGRLYDDSSQESLNGNARVAYMALSDGYVVCVFNRVSLLTGEVIDLSQAKSDDVFSEIDWSTSGMMVFASDGTLVFGTPDNISRYCIHEGILTYEKSGSTYLYRVNLKKNRI